MSIDTLSIARRLREANVPSEQAEAIAAVIGQSAHDSAEVTPTKADLASIAYEVAGFRSLIRETESKLEAKIEAVQTKMIMWFVGTQLAFVALIGAMIKL